MALIVQKFGGTSVKDIERIRNVAQRALETQRAGNDVIVVVSAMAGETNRLLELTRQANPCAEQREQDVVASTGEQVTIGLTALAIQALGGKARSFTGFQVPIVTDDAFAKARIRSIERSGLLAALGRGEIAVVAGFQGICEDGSITTLGRGGSDTTAVAIAAALEADACEIYTDVDGVYTADPNLVPQARKLERISYEEMLELAGAGAKVLQIRSVEFAMKYGVPLWVKSSFTRAAGTVVCREEAAMEHVVVSGIAQDRNEAKIALRGVDDRPGIAARLFGRLSAANIVVDLIVQNVARQGKTDVTFTVAKADLPRAMEAVTQVKAELGVETVETDDRIAKVSIVGVGMRNHAGVASLAFEVLGRAGINIEMISTSEIKISMVIHEKFLELAVRELHGAFTLDAPAKLSA
ncbi:MAG TPA: aspartate kinase [Anaeromyxobacteraceae bacterium]|nr:aspartate kinase [Anaeromyxobacteraceae bacterium]